MSRLVLNQAWLIAVLAALGCQPPGENRPHISLDAEASELRAALNADSGKVRVVMLVAPT